VNGDTALAAAACQGIDWPAAAVLIVMLLVLGGVLLIVVRIFR
jgi:hypothetical protein